MWLLLLVHIQGGGVHRIYILTGSRGFPTGFFFVCSSHVFGRARTCLEMFLGVWLCSGVFRRFWAFHMAFACFSAFKGVFRRVEICSETFGCFRGILTRAVT